MRGWAGLVLAAVIGCALGGPLRAQLERYALGRRFIELEQAAAAHASPGERKAVAADIGRALRSFFALDLGAAVGAIDAARLSLEHGVDAVPDAQRWACSLSLSLERQLLDATQESASVELKALYDVDEVERPAAATLVVQFGSAAPIEHGIAALPMALPLPLAALGPGDHSFTWRVVVDGEVSVERTRWISLAADVDARIARRLAQLREMGKPRNTEHATARGLLQRCRLMRRGRQQEIDYPAASMLAEVEMLLDRDAAAPPVYVAARSGTFWIDFVTEPGVQACRVQVPKHDPAASAPPLVIAMHGVGGSENLFFEGESGLTPKLCAERGWLLVTTRSTIGRGPKIDKLLDAIAVRYPFDAERVFLVGHSMGAMQATQAARRHPGRIAKVAALGGAGNLEDASVLAPVSFWIGVGSRDFAHAPALRMHRLLRAASVDAELKVFPEVGHVLIVQDALPGVFEFFDG